MISMEEVIETRCSIRHFRPDDVPDELIRQVLEAARLAPSASNIQPWRFLVIIDKATIHYILPVLPKNSSKDMSSSSSAASTYAQRLTLKKF